MMKMPPTERRGPYVRMRETTVGNETTERIRPRTHETRSCSSFLLFIFIISLVILLFKLKKGEC